MRLQRTYCIITAPKILKNSKNRTLSLSGRLTSDELQRTMAASTYLLELDQRRERILSGVVDCLSIPAGSTAHELALSFAARSLAHHDQLDAETQKVSVISILGLISWTKLYGYDRMLRQLLVAGAGVVLIQIVGSADLVLTLVIST